MIAACAVLGLVLLGSTHTNEMTAANSGFNTGPANDDGRSSEFVAEREQSQ